MAYYSMTDNRNSSPTYRGWETSFKLLLKMIMKKIRALQAKKSIKVLLYTAVTAVAILAYLIVFLCLIWCFTGALYTNGIIFINSRILK
jgi:hypothetical protein